MARPKKPGRKDDFEAEQPENPQHQRWLDRRDAKNARKSTGWIGVGMAVAGLVIGAQLYKAWETRDNAMCATASVTLDERLLLPDHTLDVEVAFSDSDTTDPADIAVSNQNDDDPATLLVFTPDDEKRENVHRITLAPDGEATLEDLGVSDDVLGVQLAHPNEGEEFTKEHVNIFDFAKLSETGTRNSSEIVVSEGLNTQGTSDAFTTWLSDHGTARSADRCYAGPLSR